MKEIFKKEKIDYKNIDIPEDLEFISIKSINEVKKKNNYNLMFLSKILILSLIILLILLMIFPKLYIKA